MSQPTTEPTAPTPTPPPAPAPTPEAPPTPTPPAQETDWVSEARKWESRAKENKTAADELAALKAAQMTEAEKAAARAAELEAKVKGYETKEQTAAWKAQVSTETGVPAAVLAGSTLEEIQAHAETLKPLITQAPQEPQVPLAPHVPGEGAPPSGGVASQLNANDIASMSPQQVNAARKAGRLNTLMGIH